MKKLSIAILLFLSIFKFSDTYAQIIIPFHSFANPQNLNPAFTGFFQNPRIGLNYFNIVKQNSIRTNVNYDQHLDFIKGGIGLTSSYISSSDGTRTSLNIGGFYAYEVELGENSGLRVGINPSYNLETIDMNRYSLFGSSMLQPGQSGYTDDKLSRSYFNIGAGMLGFYENYYAGISVQNITEPEVNFRDRFITKVPRTFNLHTGGFIHLTDDVKKGWIINPNILFQGIAPVNGFNSDWWNTYSLGLNVSRSIVNAGIRYSIGGENYDISTVQASLGLNIGNVKVGYAAHIWDTNRFLGPIHEISLIYQFNKSKGVSDKKMINNFSRIF